MSRNRFPLMFLSLSTLIGSRCTLQLLTSGPPLGSTHDSLSRNAVMSGDPISHREV